MNYRGLLKGNTIELAERLPFPDGQPLRVSVEAWPAPPPAGSAPPHLSRSAVDELEAAIAQGQIPVNDGWAFNAGK